MRGRYTEIMRSGLARSPSARDWRQEEVKKTNEYCSYNDCCDKNNALTPRRFVAKSG